MVGCLPVFMRRGPHIRSDPAGCETEKEEDDDDDDDNKQGFPNSIGGFVFEFAGV
jgi:hypothetical protein